MADPRTTRPDDPLTAFGPNEWLVDELYQQYLEDKNSVDKAWWEFFADYTPDGVPGGSSANGSNGAAPAPAPAKPAAAKPAETKAAPAAKPAEPAAPRPHRAREAR